MINNEVEKYKMSEKVSIIIPVYNVEPWLDECINSVVEQTYKNIEIILVDDGSTDGSGKICEDWSVKDHRISVIHKKNGGLSSARNTGLDIFTGEYVTFLDSDDYIEPNTIEYMLKNMKDKGADIVCCAMNKVINGKCVESKDINKEKLYLRNELLDGFFYYKDGLCGSVCDKLFKSVFFKDLRFPEGLNSEDYYVLFNIYLRTNKMFYNNQCFYNYRTRENSICTTYEITEHSFDKIKISDKVRKITEEEIPERVLDAEAYQIISRFFIYSEIVCRDSSNKNKREWIRELRKYKKSVLKNKKIDCKFKLKYFGFAYMTEIFSRLLKKYYFTK